MAIPHKAIGGSGAFSLLTEVAADKGVPFFMIVRVLQGVCQGGLNAPQKSLWGKWTPVAERTTFVGSFRSFTSFGTLLMNVASRRILNFKRLKYF